MPHYWGQMPMYYRQAMTYRNGNRTLNYPAVGVSSARRSLNSKVTGLNGNAHVLHHSNGNLQN
jgi:hypothetical protein